MRIYEAVASYVWSLLNLVQNRSWHAQWNKWCHAYNWELFERYIVKSYCSIQLKLFYRWQQGVSLVIPYCTVMRLQLFKIFDYLQRGDAIMAKNQFQGHQEKSKKLAECQQGQGLVQRTRRDFFFLLIIVSDFPSLRIISQQHQRACCLSEPDPDPVQSC